MVVRHRIKYLIHFKSSLINLETSLSNKEELAIRIQNNFTYFCQLLPIVLKFIGEKLHVEICCPCKAGRNVQCLNSHLISRKMT